MFPKIWFLSYSPKTSKQIEMQDYLNHTFSQKNVRYEVEFLDMITDRKFYKNSLGKLTYFVDENCYNHFLVFGL